LTVKRDWCGFKLLAPTNGGIDTTNEKSNQSFGPVGAAFFNQPDRPYIKYHPRNHVLVLGVIHVGHVKGI